MLQSYRVVTAEKLTAHFEISVRTVYRDVAALGEASALLKVRAALPEGHKRYISKLGSSMEVWSRPSGFEMEKSLMPLQQAVVRRRCVTIEYDTGRQGKIY